MANQEHLDILKQGVEAWNQWRKEHPAILPDLSEAYLVSAHLNGANLSAANLSAANLRYLQDKQIVGISVLFNRVRTVLVDLACFYAVFLSIISNGL